MNTIRAHIRDGKHVHTYAMETRELTFSDTIYGRIAIWFIENFCDIVMTLYIILVAVGGFMWIYSLIDIGGSQALTFTLTLVQYIVVTIASIIVGTLFTCADAEAEFNWSFYYFSNMYNWVYYDDYEDDIFAFHFIVWIVGSTVSCITMIIHHIFDLHQYMNPIQLLIMSIITSGPVLSITITVVYYSVFMITIITYNLIRTFVYLPCIALRNDIRNVLKRGKVKSE